MRQPINIIAELPIEKALRQSMLTSSDANVVKANGRRICVANLKTFAYHGCTCVRCGRVGNRIIAWIDKGGGMHVDLYCKQGDRMTLMNRDHIIPKSKRGPNTHWNYQTMCVKCNTKKADNETPEDVRLSQFRTKWRDTYVVLQDNFWSYVPAFLRKSPVWNRRLSAFRDLYLHRITYLWAKVVA